MGNVKIRTTINPGETLSVDSAEADILEAQGLVHSSESGKHGKHKWKADEAAADAAPAAKADDKKEEA